MWQLWYKIAGGWSSQSIASWAQQAHQPVLWANRLLWDLVNIIGCTFLLWIAKILFQVWSVWVLNEMLFKLCSASRKTCYTEYGKNFWKCTFGDKVPLHGFRMIIHTVALILWLYTYIKVLVCWWWTVNFQILFRGAIPVALSPMVPPPFMFWGTTNIWTIFLSGK